VRHCSGYRDGVADVLGKGDSSIAIELPMLIVGGEKKKASRLGTLLDATGYVLGCGRFVVCHLRRTV
jgi:hypothetical protein